MMRSLSALAWRNLQQHRLRTLLSATGVALGVAMVLVADVTGDAIRNAGQAIEKSQDTVAFAGDFLNSALSMMGLVILVAAGFLIFNAFGMAVTQRQRQIGALRSLGLTRRQVMRLILVEASLTGGVGTALGLALGPLLGRGLVVLLAELVGVAHGPSSVRAVSLARGIGLGMGITLLATSFPARRATRIAPLVALRVQEATGAEPDQRRRAALGLILATLLLFYLVVSPPAAHVPTPPWDIILTGLFALGWLFGLGMALPFLISGVSAVARRIGARRGAVGRLAADNLGRARRRVILTIITLAVGLMMIVSVTGMTTFSFDVIVNYAVRNFDLDWVIAPLPQSSESSVVGWDVLSKWDSSTMVLTPEFVAELENVTAGRANLVHGRPLFLPELAILSGLPSYAVDPVQLRRAELFAFAEGDWETAQPIMASGCGLLLTPRMARSHNVRLYDTLTLPGTAGPVACTVAGLGTSSFLGTTVVSLAGAADLDLDQDRVFITILQPLPDVDRERLRADLDALLSGYPGNSLFEVESFFQDVSAMVGSLKVMLNGMLLLAILAAALGVINTTMISVTERRAELGLLRAVGATRRQVRAVVAGEAILMGLIGGLLGLLAGLGLIVIYIVTNGGNLYGLSDLPLWSSAWKSIQPAILSGLIGLVATPLICAGAAWLAAHPLLRGAAIETLHPERAGLRALGRFWRSRKGFKRG